ncbi:TonB-dependent receptor [Chroococcidiopsis sp. FACHB-1243]|uniref:TonB-dependent siderophore receptor n=1 Tax=Chroococcidiopsis sp. [FACHB-1243] TaxID=2692781 RepID=UPI001781B3E4|nr:TonB-dependent receptor [Chroococcidiopsis sp. [FACHB-1243]]MBD2305336.1 TonB-dependent receptor [Chroococcidiopsis sp. [FACHB-1243]]
MVELTLLPQPAWADSEKDLRDAEGGLLRDHRNSNLSNCAIANSFQAAYVNWDTVENCHGKKRSHQTSREFDFDDYSLNGFYVLNFAWNNEFKTGTLQHEIGFEIELNKFPFLLPTKNIDSQASEQFNLIDLSTIPLPFSPYDFTSRQNSLSLSISNETAIGRLSISFEGSLDLVINDTTDLPELHNISQQEYEAFNPELEISYQLSSSISVYTNLSYSALPIPRISRSLLKPEIENGLEIGIETEFFNDRISATLYLYDGIQRNVTLTDANDPELELLVEKQTSQDIGLEVVGEIAPGWNAIAYYAYTKARIARSSQLPVNSQVPNIASHNGGFWTTYEIQAGALQGLGFGGGVRYVGDRPGNIENSFKLPSYWQTDLAVFYQRKNWKAALNIENLLDVDYFEGTPLTVLGTIFVEF